MTKTDLKILQWNIRGYVNNYCNLQLLIKSLNPKIIALQETHLKCTNNIPIPINFSLIISQNPYNSFAGSAILIHNSIQHSILNVTHNKISVVNITIQSKMKFILSSIYIPPNTHICTNDLDQLFNPNGPPTLLVGDFNGWHTSWGATTNNKRGKIISKFISSSALTILNDGSPTHFSSHHTLTHIDISIASPILALQCSWKTEKSLSGSDHFPITISIFPQSDNTYIIKKPRFQVERANWEKYKEIAEKINSQKPSSTSINQETAIIRKIIIESANESIPQTKTKHKPTVPWWNAELQKLKAEKNHYWNILRRNTNNENIINFKKTRAMFRRTLKLSKRRSIDNFTTNINPSTPSGKIWSTIRTLCGTKPSFPIHCIQSKTQTNTFTTDKSQIADEFGQFWSKQALDTNFSQTFQVKKQNILHYIYNIRPSKSAKLIERPINKIELQMALNKLRGKTPGLDRISYPMIKNLPDSVLNRILNLFNDILNEYIPSTFKTSLVIPILKPNMEKTKLESYRPIQLNSCDSKVLDRIIANRLWWFATSNKLLNNRQIGFKKGKSIADHLIYLDHQISESINNKRHLSIISLDFAKAYDRVGIHSVLDQLIEWNIGPKMFNYIKDYMFNRKIKVKITHAVSKTYILQNGIPQGSPLSVILFLIAYNRLSNIIESYKNFDCLAYADDFIIMKKLSKSKTTTIDINPLINDIIDWGKYSGAMLALSKCKHLHLCRKQNCSTKVTCNNLNITTVNEMKILGIIFNKRYKWNSHIEYLSLSLKNRLSIVKCLSSKKFSCNTATLIQVVKAIICSKINYGIYMFGFAPKSTLNKLQTVINTATRIALNAYRTSPIYNMLYEANIMPLEISRDFITAKQTIASLIKDKSPTSSTLSRLHKSKKQQKIPSTLNTIRTIALNHGFPINHKCDTYQRIPHWNIQQGTFNTEMSKFLKDATPPETYNQFFTQIKNNLSDYTFIYTDGSKINSSISYSIVCNNKILKIAHLPAYSSNFSAELIALNEAIKLTFNQAGNFAICTDSLSAVKAIQNPNKNNYYTNNIRNYILKKPNKYKLIWVPGHSKITGNEIADTAAKNAIRAPLYTTPNLLRSDIKKHLKYHFLNKQNLLINHTSPWYTNINYKLININNYLSHTGLNRQDQIKILRLRIGHTRLTQQHVLDKNLSNSCPNCNYQPNNVEHILDTCTQSKHFRGKHDIPAKPSDLLKNPTSDNLLLLIKYLKLANIYNYL